MKQAQDTGNEGHYTFITDSERIQRPKTGRPAETSQTRQPSMIRQQRRSSYMGVSD